MKNDLSACTQFIQQFTDVDQYQDALGHVAALKFEGRYADALVYVKAHSRGDWRTSAVRTLADYYFTQRDAEKAGAEFLKLDLVGVDRKFVANSAKTLAAYWSWKQGMADPLNWTLKLPSDLAPDVRKRWSESPSSGGHLLGQFLRWTDAAPISPEERAALQTTLLKRQQANPTSP